MDNNGHHLTKSSALAHKVHNFHDFRGACRSCSLAVMLHGSEGPTEATRRPTTTTPARCCLTRVAGNGDPVLHQCSPTRCTGLVLPCELRMLRRVGMRAQGRCASRQLAPHASHPCRTGRAAAWPSAGSGTNVAAVPVDPLPAGEEGAQAGDRRRAVVPVQCKQPDPAPPSVCRTASRRGPRPAAPAPGPPSC
jgi:hypothetical protein